MPIESLTDITGFLNAHDTHLNASFALVPSENQLSPLARIAYQSDAYARYFFNEKEVFGRWSFEGGSIAGKIQTELLVPGLCKIGGAKHVNLHGISGLTAMIVALTALSEESGVTVLSVPVEFGGHPDTGYVGAKLGCHMKPIPFSAFDQPDIDALHQECKRSRPKLIYIDHATHLFPLDLSKVISAIKDASPETTVHVDTSHVNGLIWGGVLDNPLDCGADSYGGSTHKTFPGPHKAVLFTNDDDLNMKIILTAVNMISHHHTASVISLAFAVHEWITCGGEDYARQIVLNAKAFAKALEERGLDIAQRDGQHTENHQVWMSAPGAWNAYDLASTMFRAGLVVNPFNPLPGFTEAAIRFGVAEPTKLGLKEANMSALADLVAAVSLEGEDPGKVADRTRDLRSRFECAYCVPAAEVKSLRDKMLP